MAESSIEEIIVTRSTIGDGTGASPYRSLVEYFTKEGERLFSLDSWTPLTEVPDGQTARENNPTTDDGRLRANRTSSLWFRSW